MARKKRAARRAARNGGVSKKTVVKEQKTGKSIPALIEKQNELLKAGKVQRAGRVANRIAKRAMRNPAAAAPVGEQYAQKEFETNLTANRPNQETIGGNRQYVTDPVTGEVTVKDSLSPEQQRLYDQQTGQLSAANQAFMSAFQNFAGNNQIGQAYDFSGAPQAPNLNDLNAAREQQFQQVYDLNVKPVQQEFDRQRSDLEQRLYNQGHMPDSPAFKQQMAQLNEQFKPSFDSVRSQAYDKAGQELERSFNLGTQGRSNYMQEQVFGRTQPLSELGALAQFGGGPTATPQFFNFQPVQYQGPQYLDYLNAGINAQLGRGALQNDQAQIARMGAGGGGGAPAQIPFSIGGAPGALPPGTNAPNPITSGFAAGVQGGIGVGAGLA